MAKNIKLNIKNTQIAEAINLGGLKGKLAKKKSEAAAKMEQETKGKEVSATKASAIAEPGSEIREEPAPRIKARSKSAFAESSQPEEIKVEPAKAEEPLPASVEKDAKANFNKLFVEPIPEEKEATLEPIIESKREEEKKEEPQAKVQAQQPVQPAPPKAHEFPKDRLGPTGRHVKDLLPPPRPPKPAFKGEREQHYQRRPEHRPAPTTAAPQAASVDLAKGKNRVKTPEEILEEEQAEAKKGKLAKVKEFKDVKPAKRVEPQRSFDARDRQGLRAGESEDEHGYRRRRKSKQPRIQQEDVTIRPTSLKVRLPISIKDLASEMKLKASQLIAKLFLQGLPLTLNDILDDETTIQLLGQEFGCEITIDTSEEEKKRITDKSIRDEIKSSNPESLKIRPPVVAFMGHVDHGKTSLIDAIRKSNRAASEAGAITQHIGAFCCHTAVGDIAILDTPGHEAFSAMRARGADVTDIVVLVVAGDEGIRQQTLEAIQHAKAAKVTIIVAINKADKPNFNPEIVYRQLAENDLLPEVWGGQIITVNCSAVTGQGIKELLEMLALQAEVLELRANPNTRARGSVLESEMHKGMGSVATVLVQNGTLKLGDALVFSHFSGRVKTMRNEFAKELREAGPSTPVEITGLSGLPEAGEEFIVVATEKEAKEIAEARTLDMRQKQYLAKRQTVESLFQQAAESPKKVLNAIVRADVQGSLEALKAGLMKIESEKVDLNIIFAGVGEISESDVQLAAASKAVIIGFHTAIESHAESLIKQMGIQVRLHDIIYHAIDDAKVLMKGTLDKIPVENEKGKAMVKATFKSSHAGTIAGCIVTDGEIKRNYQVRVMREGNMIWKGSISSLKRLKEDVREVQKGLECGIILNGFSECKENDVLEAFEVTYITQEI